MACWTYKFGKLMPCWQALEMEQKMRNKITILDPSYPKLTFDDLEQGEMFRYPKSSNGDDAVYMKVNPSLTTSSTAAVYLVTGQLYITFDRTKEVQRVSLIQLSRPI